MGSETEAETEEVVEKLVVGTVAGIRAVFDEIRRETVLALTVKPEQR